MMKEKETGENIREENKPEKDKKTEGFLRKKCAVVDSVRTDGSSGAAGKSASCLG